MISCLSVVSEWNDSLLCTVDRIIIFGALLLTICGFQTRIYMERIISIHTHTNKLWSDANTNVDMPKSNNEAAARYANPKQICV